MGASIGKVNTESPKMAGDASRGNSKNSRKKYMTNISTEGIMPYSPRDSTNLDLQFQKKKHNARQAIS